MSDRVPKPSHDEDAKCFTSRMSSQTSQPSWVSHWTGKNPVTASRVNDSYLVCNKDRGLNLNGVPKSGKGLMKYPETMLTTGVISEPMKQGRFKSESSDPFVPSPSGWQNTENTSTIRTQVDHEFGNKDLSLALALGRGETTSTDLNLRHDSSLRSNGKQCVPYSFEGKKDLAVSRSGFGLAPHGSNKADTSRPLVVFEKHFSNDNFTCFGQDSCKYRKYSSFMVHETDMKNGFSNDSRQNDELHLQHGQSANKNFQDFFGTKQSRSPSSRFFPTSTNLSNIDHGKSRLTDNVPCSVRNVETMRICTMVDSVENSPGGQHKISQRAHHVLFTKETCVNMSNGMSREPNTPNPYDDKTYGHFNVSPDMAPFRPSGVKIQPLWTSTDSEEKENTGNPSVSKAGSSNEASAENCSQQEEATKSQHILSGMASSPLRKDNTVEESTSPAACDSSTEKSRSKRPLLEIPDINEELPGLQPAVSSTDDEEPSTSRVHSLNAKHLFPSKKQSSRHAYNDDQDHSVSPEASNRCQDTSSRWIKRLKLNSSDSFGVGTKSSAGEGSSHQKFNMFFNRIMKNSRESLDPKLHELHSKEPKALDQNAESVVSKKRDQSTMNGCSWIQRWCQPNTAPQPRNPEPLVVCEPHSMKFGQEELAKKHFPSIGALALMGKAMNGYRSCEFNKRGSVVVWNTREY